MSDDALKNLEAEEARLRERLETIQRDKSELARLRDLAAKYNLALVPQNTKAVQLIETIRDLADHYLTHPDSPYHKLKFVTRDNYSRNIKRILAGCGDKKLADLEAREIDTLYEGWSSGGRMATGHALVTMLRVLMIYGANNLSHKECKTVTVTLHNMDFAVPKARKELLTVEQITGIIRKAQESGRHSIALAQALQYECGLKQKDTIGEWVPQAEAGVEVSDVFDNNEKWVRGLRWSDIDGNVLHHVGITTTEANLRDCPLVMAELARIDPRDRVGAVVKDEDTGLPYRSWKFRRLWRPLATMAGVPKAVWNTDVPARAKSEKFRATEGDTSVAR